MMANEISTILNDQKVKQELLRLSELYRGQIKYWELRNRLNESTDVGTWDEIQIRAIEHHSTQDVLSNIRTLLHDEVFARLSRPHCVTSQDLMNAIRRFLFQGDDTETAYERLAVHAADTSTMPRQSPPLPVGTYVCLDFGGQQHETWSNSQGFAARIVGFVPLRMEHDQFSETSIGEFVRAPQRVYVRFTGQGSSRAFAKFKREAASVMRICIDGVHGLNRLAKFESFRPLGLPLGLFWRALDAYFVQPRKPTRREKANTFGPRIRNALLLLVESRRQRHDAVGLALSIGAIEAMLGDKGEGIAEQLAERVAVLMEPDSKVRADAKAFVKRLYSARSESIHGSNLEHEHKSRQDAWILAFAIFRALLEREKFQMKSGVDVEAPSEFFQELEHSKFRGGEIPGVSSYPVRAFWNPNLSEEELGAALKNLWPRSSRVDDDDFDDAS